MKDNCEEEISKFRICIEARINSLVSFYLIINSFLPVGNRCLNEEEGVFVWKNFQWKWFFLVSFFVVGKREGKQAVVNNSFRGGNEFLAGQELRRYLDAVPLEYTEDDFPETNHPRLRRASKLCSRHEFGNASRLFSRIHWPKWVARGHLR